MCTHSGYALIDIAPALISPALISTLIFGAYALQDYQGLNAYRSTSAELKEKEKLENHMYEEVREAAEVHRTARKYLQSIAKPGMLMIDLATHS